MKYIITATVVEKTENGTITHQIPAFFLDVDMLGIVSAEHAAKIAEDILNPCHLENLMPHVFAMLENQKEEPISCRINCRNWVIVNSEWNGLFWNKTEWVSRANAYLYDVCDIGNVELPKNGQWVNA